MEILVYSCSLKVFAPKKSKLAVITGVMVPAFSWVLWGSGVFSVFFWPFMSPELCPVLQLRPPQKQVKF